MRRRTKARELALKALYQIEMAKDPIDKSLERFWRMEDEKDASVRDFTAELVAGVTEHRADIDKAIAAHAENWDINRMATVDRNVMRISCYELLYRDDIPPKVSINEAVDIAKRYGDVDSGKFVNGILDKISKLEKKSEDDG